MKSLCALLIALWCLPLSAQKASLELDYTTLDRGEMMYKSDGVFRFPFTNTGEDTLIISNVKSSCGCLVPDYRNESIPPGGKDTIIGKYDTKRLGNFHKTMTISSNDFENPLQIVRIRGGVYEALPTVRVFSSDSLPERYHRAFWTKHTGKQLYVGGDSAKSLRYTIGPSDSIELFIENNSVDTLKMNLENLTTLELVQWVPTKTHVSLCPNESVHLQFRVVDRSRAAGERRKDFAQFIIHDTTYTLEFAYPYR